MPLNSARDRVDDWLCDASANLMGFLPHYYCTRIYSNFERVVETLDYVLPLGSKTLPRKYQGGDRISTLILISFFHKRADMVHLHYISIDISNQLRCECNLLFAIGHMALSDWSGLDV